MTLPPQRRRHIASMWDAIAQMDEANQIAVEAANRRRRMAPLLGGVTEPPTVPQPEILLQQAVIELEDETHEGQVVLAVLTPWFEIVDEVLRDPEFLFQFTRNSRKFEEFIAATYERAGFKVTLTPASGDFGRDVIAVKRGIGTIRVIDQVKAYSPHRVVDANDVRALMGVLQTDGAAKGFLTTTSNFAPGIATDPLIQPWIPSRLELINGEMLKRRLKELRDDPRSTGSH